MPTRVLADDIDPELIARYEATLERYRKSAPKRFLRRWRCGELICDGQPHEGWGEKHARADQVIPSSWTYQIDDPDTGHVETGETNRIAYLVGGRGSGKTWAGAHNFAQLVLETEPEAGDDHTEWGVIAPTYRSARHVCIEGPSGLIRAFGGFSRRGGLVEKWNRSDGELVLTTGAIVYIDGAGTGAERIQGENLYGAWCDEIGLWKAWRRAWEESLAFAVRIGPARIICTGTPKLSSLAKFLLDDPKVWRHRLRTVDNLANLAPAAIRDLLERYEGTRLGLQELEGLLVEDVEGALWKRSNIDAERVTTHTACAAEHGYQVGKLHWHRVDGTALLPPRHWQKVAVAIDPSDGTAASDEQGLCVVGHSATDHQLYVLESEGLHLSPFDLLSHAIDVALPYAPTPVTLVIEKNHGGKFLVALLEQVFMARGVRIPCHVVTASQSKRTRAEAVSGMWERGRVHHVDVHADLEDQMCTWTGVGREPSPDRMDALVWAVTEWHGQRLDAPRPDEGQVIRWAGHDRGRPFETVAVPKERPELPVMRW